MLPESFQSDMDEHLMMEDESLVWTSKDVVIVLQRQNDKSTFERNTIYARVDSALHPISKTSEVRVRSDTDAATFHLFFECSYSAAIWISPFKMAWNQKTGHRVTR